MGARFGDFLSPISLSWKGRTWQLINPNLCAKFQLHNYNSSIEHNNLILPDFLFFRTESFEARKL